ncbi:hypothetical protein [Pendulispora albinea]|uniref:Lipoprotein n=1 Tax=Pendulispora albinea TaxID=2741071 RepID=A0ABZ2LTA7_9BACT
MVACSGGGESSGPGGKDGPGGGQRPPNDTTSGIPSGGVLGPGCKVFPPDNPWNKDISNAEVDPNSDRYIDALGKDKKVHPDFGAEPQYGMPYILISGAQPRLGVTFEQHRESDPGPYPIPLNAPVEGAGEAGDRHVLAVDRDQCMLYELYSAEVKDGAWTAYSGAVFDLKTNKLRPDGWTSADAAGLPIFPGLVRYEEAATNGEIKHALRFTGAKTQNAFVRPATHASGSTTDLNVPPMGARFRLKKTFDISKFTGVPKAVLTALARYGMFLADKGSSWYISGESNPQWTSKDLEPLKTIPGSAFEVVKIDEIVKNPE